MVLDLKQWEYESSKTELSPEKAYRALLRNLRWTQGFGINFVECSPTGGEELIQRLRQDLATKRLEPTFRRCTLLIENYQRSSKIVAGFIENVRNSMSLLSLIDMRKVGSCTPASATLKP